MRDKLILDNLGLIYKVMKDMNCTYDSEEHIEEYYFAGLVGLIEATKYYDEEKGKSGFLYKSIQRRIISVFCKNERPKRKGKTPVSLNTTINDIELIDLIRDTRNFEKEIITRDYIDWLLNKLKNKRYKKFLLEYYGIDTPSLKMHEIASKYGVSTQFVHNSIKYALTKLKKIIKENK